MTSPPYVAFSADDDADGDRLWLEIVDAIFANTALPSIPKLHARSLTDIANGPVPREAEVRTGPARRKAQIDTPGFA